MIDRYGLESGLQIHDMIEKPHNKWESEYGMSIDLNQIAWVMMVLLVFCWNVNVVGSYKCVFVYTYGETDRMLYDYFHENSTLE